jgi:hypothetical protein
VKCAGCDAHNGSIFNPYCNDYNAPIPMDAEGHMRPVPRCAQRQEQIETIARHRTGSTGFVARLCGVFGVRHQDA